MKHGETLLHGSYDKITSCATLSMDLMRGPSGGKRKAPYPFSPLLKAQRASERGEKISLRGWSAALGGASVPLNLKKLRMA